MPGKILRRCHICGKFHASYLAPDSTTGAHYYCYKCWKALQAGQKNSPQVDNREKSSGKPAPEPDRPVDQDDEAKKS